MHQTQYDSLYVYSAVCPETGDACGLITPKVNTDTMNVFLEQFSRELPADVHAVMVLDQAGWHTAGALAIPSNVTLVHLPPKSPFRAPQPAHVLAFCLPLPSLPTRWMRLRPHEIFTSSAVALSDCVIPSAFSIALLASRHEESANPLV